MIWELEKLGNPSNPPIVFLHGFMGSGKDWLKMAQVFSKKHFCLLVDLPGHGKNMLDKNPGYHAWANALYKTLNAHGLKKITLVGYSMGGRLALYFALEYPHLISKLVLESASPGISDMQERQNRIAWDESNARRILDDGFNSFLDYWYNLPLFASLENVPDLKASLHRKRATQNPKNMATIIRALSPGTQPNLWPRLSELEMPLLLISGQLDKKYSLITEQMAGMIQHCQRIEISDCGHNIHAENFEEVVRLLDV